MIKNLILIGHGSHTKKRLLPSIKQTKLKLLSIVKKKNVFFDLNALPISDKETISYICTPPDTHHQLITFLLKKKSNVIVEKPAILKRTQYSIIEKILSKNKKLIFLENIMYIYSKIFKKFENYWRNNKNKIETIDINFLIPDFFNLGFRKKSLDKYLVLHDVGIYPLSIINFLNIKVNQIKIIKKKYKKNKLKQINIRLISNKLIININIGENKIYQNNLVISNSMGLKISFDKIFSGIAIKKEIIYQNGSKIKKKISIIDHDCFKFFLSMNVKKLRSIRKRNLSMIKKNIYLFDKIKSKINSN